MKTDKPTKIINILSFVLVFALAIGAFRLSYSSLRATALSYGIPQELTWIWPLLVDFALIVFSLSVVRASLKGERVAWPWCLVALYTAGTLAFNVIHAPDNLTAQVVAVVAPVSLFLSFETLMAMLKAEVNRNSLVLSIAQIEAEAKKKAAELDRMQHDWREKFAEERRKATLELDSQLGQLQGWIEEARLELANLISEREHVAGQYQEQLETMERTIHSYRQDIEAKKEELKGLDSGQVKVYLPANLSVSQRQELVTRLANEGMTNEAIAGALGVSVGTVKNDKKAVKIISPEEVEGTIGRNGNHRKAGG